ncbi:hypothetical protein [Hyphococcus sp.]|uniref:hypothetical protein n=1 Tax=Hyphococcus sp. TaxID=2038636 RepID=UPI002088B3A8|nr:MAG: hypothetical protein DHS20C04_28410 [Marinicaulis sp.]
MSWENALCVLIYLGFIPLLLNAGNRFCRAVVRACGAPPLPRHAPGVAAVEGAAGDAPAEEKSSAQEQRWKAGRVIGSLERILIFIGVLTVRWEVLAGVVALKTVARYKELDTQLNAEYFLIGSLASILWAVVVAALFVFFDAQFGFGLVENMRAVLGLT